MSPSPTAWGVENRQTASSTDGDGADDDNFSRVYDNPEIVTDPSRALETAPTGAGPWKNDSLNRKLSNHPFFSSEEGITPVPSTRGITTSVNNGLYPSALMRRCTTGGLNGGRLWNREKDGQGLRPWRRPRDGGDDGDVRVKVDPSFLELGFVPSIERRQVGEDDDEEEVGERVE